ncbi:MAG: hypothetical protein ABI629_15475 [bacterium]
MNRSAILLVLALGLAGYGVYTALFIPAMLIGQPVPLLLIGFLAQVVCALVAAAGLARDRAWAGLVVLLFAASVAATQVAEGFILQIVPYLRAVFIAAAAIVGALFVAAYVGRRSTT